MHNLSKKITVTCTILAVYSLYRSATVYTAPQTAQKDILDSSFFGEYPSKTFPIAEIIQKGTPTPFSIIYNNSNWERPSYRTYWQYERWNYMPSRVHYALHRLFTLYPTASISYDLVHDIGIADEAIPFVKKESLEDNVYSNLIIIALQSDVKKVLIYGNQIVLITKPKRNGIEVLNIQTDKIKPSNPKEVLLVQLSTYEGDEIDYTIVGYVNRYSVFTERIYPKATGLVRP